MLNPDFRDILSAFNAERVEYLLVGAYAVAAHGLPRATMINVEDMEVPTLSRDDLIANKRATGRPQDLADVARLTKPQG